MATGYEVSGAGPVVILVHSSVSGRRQWRSLTEALAGRYRVVALDLIGYGDRPPWNEPRPQRLTDQSALVRAIAEEVGEPLALVGHSFGGSVAMCAAAEMGARLPGLVLLEPNPFSLLRDQWPEEYREAAALRDAVKAGDAAQFVDYWNGAGTWEAMGADRRRSFAEALKPNYHEWDAVMDAPAERYVSAITASTHVVSADDTVPAIARIVSLLEEVRPDWRFTRIEGGGHMAPLTRPELVDPVVAFALDDLALRV